MTKQTPTRLVTINGHTISVYLPFNDDNFYHIEVDGDQCDHTMDFETARTQVKNYAAQFAAEAFDEVFTDEED